MNSARDRIVIAALADRSTVDGSLGRIGSTAVWQSQGSSKTDQVGAQGVVDSARGAFWRCQRFGRRPAVGIGTRGLVSCPGGSATWYSIEKLTQAVSGQKKFRKRRMRFFFRVTRASGASDIGDGCGRGAGTAPRNGTALGRRAGRVWGVVLGARRPGLTGDFRPRRAKNVFLAFFTLRRVRRCAV